MSNVITGLFDTTAAAENAVTQLKALGYGENELTIIMKDYGAAETLAAEIGSRSMEGIGAGTTIGGALGAILAGLLAVGTVTLPGVGLIAAGPLAAMLAGAGAGGIVGGLIGWFVDAGVPEDLAPYYERSLNEGGVVVAVGAHTGDEARVRDILRAEAVAYGGAGTRSYIRPDYESAPTVATASEFDRARQVSDFEAANTPRTVKLEEGPTSVHNSEHSVESRRDDSQSGKVVRPGDLWENEGGLVNTAAPPVPVDESVTEEIANES